MTGLHDYSRCNAYACVDHEPTKTGYSKLRQIDLSACSLEAFFHVGNTQKQEAKTYQRPPCSLHTDITFLEDQNDTEYQHGHGISRNIHLQTQASHQPGTGGCTQ